MKVGELLVLVEANGWRLMRQKAVTVSFIIASNQRGRRLGYLGIDVPSGTLSGVLKQAGLKPSR